MLADEADPYLVGLADVFDDLIKLSVAFRTGLHHDVTGIHAETLDRHSHCIAGIPHAFQLVEIEGPARGAFRGDEGATLRSRRSKWPADVSLALEDHVRVWADMPHAEAQVVLEILPGHDAVALCDVIVGTHMHQHIFPGNGSFLSLAGRDHRDRGFRHARAEKTTCKRFSEIPASHLNFPP